MELHGVTFFQVCCPTFVLWRLTKITPQRLSVWCCQCLALPTEGSRDGTPETSSLCLALGRCKLCRSAQLHFMFSVSWQESVRYCGTPSRALWDASCKMELLTWSLAVTMVFGQEMEIDSKQTQNRWNRLPIGKAHGKRTPWLHRFSLIFCCRGINSSNLCSSQIQLVTRYDSAKDFGACPSESSWICTDCSEADTCGSSKSELVLLLPFSSFFPGGLIHHPQENPLPFWFTTTKVGTSKNDCCAPGFSWGLM